MFSFLRESARRLFLGNLKNHTQNPFSSLESFPSSPIVVGATGGSGTRVIQNILQESGVFMGTDCNHAGDAMTFEPLLDEYINLALQEVPSVNYQISHCSAKLREQLLSCYKMQLIHFMKSAPEDTQRWGWKNPRSIYLLPFIYHLFPTMYFVHVVRDGRYIAFSNNQNQCNKHYETYFKKPLDESKKHEASIALWSDMNVAAATWAKQHLGERYLCISFETLCQEPRETLQSLFTSLHLPVNEEKLDALASLVNASKATPNWTESDPDYIKTLTQEGAAGLKYFGYLNENILV